EGEKGFKLHACPLSASGKRTLARDRAVCWLRVREQKTPYRLLRAGDAEPVGGIAHVGVVPIAAGGADIARVVHPRAAALDALGAARRLPRASIGRSAAIVAAPAVGDPLPHPACHVVEAERVRREAADGGGHARVVGLPTSPAIRLRR